MNKEADTIICLIITALARGINIILYVPKDESSNLSFVTALAQYLVNTYGITIGSEGIPYQYNTAFDHIICTRLYLHDFISYQEFFVAYPANVNIDPVAIQKLMFDMGNTVPDFGW